MKRRTTISLIISFVLISGCTFLAAFFYPNTEEQKAVTTTVSELTTQGPTGGTKETTASMTTVEEVIATVAFKQKQETVAVKDTTASVKAGDDRAGTSAPKPDISAEAKNTIESKPTTTEMTTAESTTEKHEVEPQETTEATRREEETTAPEVTTTEEKKTITTTEQKQTTEATTERAKVWHPEVTKQVWVVDVEAWTETITYTDYIDCYLCPNCGATFETYSQADAHLDASADRYLKGEIGLYDICMNFRTFQKPVEKTDTIEHPEEGHWETVVVKEGYWE